MAEVEVLPLNFFDLEAGSPLLDVITTDSLDEEETADGFKAVAEDDFSVFLSFLDFERVESGGSLTNCEGFTGTTITTSSSNGS